MTAGDLIAADGQLEWRGALLGTATPFRLDKLEGWLDLVDFRGDDFDRPSRHGAFPGASLMNKRNIVFSFKVKGVSAATFQSMVDWMRALTAPVEQPVEEPLVIRIGTQSWRSMTRCVGRKLNIDKYYAVGYTEGAIRWVATDPKLYSPAEHVASTALASPPSTGLVFPLAFPLDFGTGPVGGYLTATNVGSVAMWPKLQIDGPVTGPIISNHATGQQIVINSTYVVSAGQSLVIDTDQKQVTLKATGADDSSGVAANQAVVSRGWFPLLPGVSTRIDINQLGAYSSAALLTIRWRDAVA